MAFVIFLYILISYLVNRGIKNKDHARFKILAAYPEVGRCQSLNKMWLGVIANFQAGFRQAGAPNVSPDLLKVIAPHLPVTIIVLIIEHIATSKSFGRVNNYAINPSARYCNS